GLAGHFWDRMVHRPGVWTGADAADWAVIAHQRATSSVHSCADRSSLIFPSSICNSVSVLPRKSTVAADLIGRKAEIERLAGRPAVSSSRTRNPATFSFSCSGKRLVAITFRALKCNSQPLAPDEGCDTSVKTMGGTKTPIASCIG